MRLAQSTEGPLIPDKPSTPPSAQNRMRASHATLPRRKADHHMDGEGTDSVWGTCLMLLFCADARCGLRGKVGSCCWCVSCTGCDAALCPQALQTSGGVMPSPLSLAVAPSRCVSVTKHGMWTLSLDVGSYSWCGWWQHMLLIAWLPRDPPLLLLLLLCVLAASFHGRQLVAAV